MRAGASADRALSGPGGEAGLRAPLPDLPAGSARKSAPHGGTRARSTRSRGTQAALPERDDARYDGEVSESLVGRQGRRVSMRMARRSASLLSSHNRMSECAQRERQESPPTLCIRSWAAGLFSDVPTGASFWAVQVQRRASMAVGHHMDSFQT